MADTENTVEEAVEETGKQGGLMGKLLLGGGAIALLAVGIFAGPAIQNMIAPADDAATEEVAEEEAAPVVDDDAPEIYQGLHPAMVVNFRDSLGEPHFMQVEMEVMARNQDVINAVREHTPLIRNNLILLYGGVSYEEITTRAGKEKMLADGLAEIQAVLAKRVGTPNVEALYFTSLIIQ